MSSPPPPPCPAAQAQAPQQLQQIGQPFSPAQYPSDSGPAVPAAAKGCRDYTQVPKEMDTRLEQLDSDGAVRPAIINPGRTWTKRAQKALLAKPTKSTLGSQEQ